MRFFLLHTIEIRLSIYVYLKFGELPRYYSIVLIYMSRYCEILACALWTNMLKAGVLKAKTQIAWFYFYTSAAIVTPKNRARRRWRIITRKLQSNQCLHSVWRPHCMLYKINYLIFKTSTCSSGLSLVFLMNYNLSNLWNLLIVKWIRYFLLEVIVYHYIVMVVFQKGINHHCADVSNVYVKMGMEFAIYLGSREESSVGKGSY